MTVTQEQIQKIAEKLSKVPGDNDKLTGNIQDILGYMDLLNELDTEGVEPTISVVTQGQGLREDTEKAKDPLPEELINCSNQKVVSNQIILPNIMK